MPPAAVSPCCLPVLLPFAAQIVCSLHMPRDSHSAHALICALPPPRAADEEGEAAAAAAMQQAAQTGHEDRMFALMQRREQQHDQAHGGGGKKARLLQKLSGSPGAKAAAGPSTGTLPDALRQAASRKLAAALGGNAALATAVGGQVAALASALEQQLAAAGHSKPVYQSQHANLALAIKKAAAPADVPALAALLGTGGSLPAGGPATAAAEFAAPRPALTPQQLQARVAEAARLAAAATTARSSGGKASHPAAAAPAALEQLGGLAVTAELLAATGAGRQVHKLAKHPVPAVAAAAAACERAWKAQLTAAGVK